MTKFDGTVRPSSCPACGHGFLGVEVFDGYTECGACGTCLQVDVILRPVGKARVTLGRGLRPALVPVPGAPGGSPGQGSCAPGSTSG